MCDVICPTFFFLRSSVCVLSYDNECKQLAQMAQSQTTALFLARYLDVIAGILTVKCEREEKGFLLSCHLEGGCGGGSDDVIV